MREMGKICEYESKCLLIKFRGIFQVGGCRHPQCEDCSIYRANLEREPNYSGENLKRGRELELALTK